MIDPGQQLVIAKTPLRISLVGGSTDLDSFLNKYNHGSVISFTPNLYTFITLHTNNTNKYIVNYSKKEECVRLNQITNDIARECLKFFDTKYCTITFNSNILSSGSGLASSSSYTISLVKAISIYKNIELTNYQICDIAHKIEKTFNPLAGQQDIYGCGIGSFKRIDFSLDKPPSYRYLDFSFITNEYSMYLLNTNITRVSTDILKTIDIDKSYELINLVNDFENIILLKNTKDFFSKFNDGWKIKKNMSKEITSHKVIKKIDSVLSSIDGVFGHKLCGGGGGGYFLVFVDTDQNHIFQEEIRQSLPQHQLTTIKLDNDSIRGYTI